MPWLVKLHIVLAFLTIGFFPFTRLVHVLVIPNPYLWRKPQVVRWYGATEGPAAHNTMEVRNKATRIDLFSLKTPQMRAFHMSWFAFFLCFFAWFGIAPLMAVVREELGLTKEQIGNTIIASVAITIVARLFIGWLCDRIGPRLSYTFLLIFGSIPVMAIGLAHSLRVVSAVSPGDRRDRRVVRHHAVPHVGDVRSQLSWARPTRRPPAGETWAAASRRWSCRWSSPAFVWLGFTRCRLPGDCRWSPPVASALLTGIAYFFFTTDLPDGNFKELRASGEIVQSRNGQGLVLAGGEGLSCLGVVLHLRRLLRHRTDDQQHRRHLLHGLLRPGLEDGRAGGRPVRADEHLRPHAGRLHQRPVRANTAASRDVSAGCSSRCLIEGIALMFFSQMRVLALGDSGDDRLQPVRADVRRCHVLDRSVHQQEGTGIGGGHRRCRRQHGSGLRRVSVPIGEPDAIHRHC